MQTPIETILEILRDSGMALSLFDLADRAQLPADIAQTALNALCAEGKAAITKKGKYAVPKIMGLTAARAAALRSGAPVAYPLDGGDPMKITSTGRTRCLPDDIILVRINGNDCELVSIASRTMKELPAFVRVERYQARRNRSRHTIGRGTTAEHGSVLTGTACDRRIPYSIVITGSDVPVENDEIALLSIEEYPDGDRPIYARVLRVLGSKSDMHARLKVIAESHGFSTASDLRARFDALSETDIAGREDLRGLTVFTIDGPFSKDFDDAVSLDRAESGDWRLGVHIADVSHYVRPGSEVDLDARARGTSLYLPGLTVPMLPEILSGNLCSLMPDADRLALSLFMTVRGDRIIDHHLTASVIHSRARLTYDNVNRFFDGETEIIDASLHEILRDMLTLSHRLRARRFSHGCIELDLPETEFTLDENSVPIDVFTAPRGESERMIEDFMLAANETVAMLARTTSTPLVYRIHEDPDGDRLRELERFLANLNLHTHIGTAPHPGVLQQVIENSRDHPSAGTIHRMLLRSLARAQYSEKPQGHYALAMDDYCHFTSPIRRYPDLIVHRMLKRLMNGAADSISERSMAEIARESSAREQEATLAERDADSLLKARYMQDRIGKKYIGVITGVTAWGLYVTLDNTVEGLVHIATLDDYYDYDRERNRLIAFASGNEFRLGDRVRVRVEYADLDRGEIDFSLIGFARDM